jgi:hypothetical protein
MRTNPIPLITALLFTLSAASQEQRYDLLLKNGKQSTSPNITKENIGRFNQSAARTNGKAYAIIQFNNLPGEVAIRQLKDAGIELLNYIPYNTYSATVTGNLDDVSLKQLDIRSVYVPQPEQKVLPQLVDGVYPSWSIKQPGTIDLWLNIAKSFSIPEVTSLLQSLNAEITETKFSKYYVLGIRTSPSRITEFASLPYVEYVEPAPHEDQPLIDQSRSNSRANVLQAPVASGGRGLNGENIVIGIGDNALPFHTDFTSRIIDRAGAPPNYHGTHVHGIAGGAGILKELYQGYLPKSKLLSQVFSGVWLNAPAYYTDHRMVVTNNSYGAIVNECSYNGLYDQYSRMLDLLSVSLPKVQHVFAAGNSGTGSGYAPCPPYPTDFRTVLGSYQSAKNVLTVGNTYADGIIFPQSSRGPVKDGRIKPEITAQGSLVMSTATFAPYFRNTGTSMAAPAVSGGLGLLYQHYRGLHGDTDPDNALMKAILCNTATDKGNPGPDYTYGFGWMNLLRAVEVLEKNQYLTNSISTGGNNSFNVSVPANTAQLKVMLYWNDPAAAAVSSLALVNDLDLSVVNGSTTYLPWRLDTLPANVNNPAVRAADHINNIEQVTIDNPAPGTYSINVSGTAIPVNGPQQYVVVYDTVMNATTLTFPAGGEKLLPGETIVVNWDAFGTSANDFTLDFFDGSSWSTVNAAIPASARQYNFVVPSIATELARFRITRNSTSMVSTGNPVTILGAPRIVRSDSTCEGYMHLKWRTVTGATDYEVMKLANGEMINAGFTADTVFLLTGLPVLTETWLSVRARINGVTGRRDTAFVVRAFTGNCDSSIYNNDLKLDAIVSPSSSGRVFTSTALTASMPVTVRIKNLDNAPAPAGNITVSYRVNGGSPINHIITNPVIPALGTLDYTFTSDPLPMSAVGTYSIEATVLQPGDPYAGNNSLTRVFKQLDNQPVPIATPWLDNLEAAASQDLRENQMGLNGLDRYDFFGSTIYRRLRSFVNTGIAFSGSKAITMDVYGFIGSLVNIDSLTGTYNLTGHDVNTEDIRLDFRYKNHGQTNHAANKVWIRGADNQNWIEVYDLYANQLPADEGYKLAQSISISDSLKAHGQVLTSSFQVRWGQAGSWNMADAQTAGGYSFDDIKLYRATDDLQLLAIDTPVSNSCGLNASTPVRVIVRNNAETATANPVPVRYRVDGGSWITENIPPIAANATVTYTFTTPIGALSTGAHLIETEVDYPTDDYFDNDTASLTINNSPVIAAFPYLQDFEAGNGDWYSNGKQNSWEYGTPSSYKINRAASGSKAWKSRISGNYNDQEKSYLYSPCFDLTGMTIPTLSFSVALDLEDCGNGGLCDGAYAEYSTDGKTWSRLGAVGQGTNWYNRNYSGGTNPVWSTQNYTRWHVATIPLPLNVSRLRLRFVITSDASVNREGIAIDDIHVYDNIYGIYPGPTMTSPVTQTISGGTTWINFLEPGTNKLIASVQPNNQDLGITNAQCYINTGPVRISKDQLYHDRNITIIPEPGKENLADSAIVRFYFLDTETERLISATNCPACYKPGSAYELGVSKYSHPDNTVENGTIDDNLINYWLFINSSKARKVPFDKGYYAEFKVKNFSEFWLNNGSFDNNQPLPAQLTSFTAKKQNAKDVIAEWTTASEFNVNRFELELAKGNSGYQQNSFIKIADIAATGNSTTERSYRFLDTEQNKAGVRYYRLKIINNDGSWQYSAIRPVVFSDEVNWQVYPNPSPGIFNFAFQAETGELIRGVIYDVSGKLVYKFEVTANGFQQKLTLDLPPATLKAGMYLLRVSAGVRQQEFRLIRQ